MFVAMSQFTVSNGMENEVRQSFIDRPKLVDNHVGFIRMEVMSPEEKPQEFMLITYWTDKSSWKEWYRGHSYKEAHSGIPKGLKLVPHETKVNYFNLFCE